MRRKSILIVLISLIFFALVGCPEYQLQDEIQLENLQTLRVNYDCQIDYFEDGEIPPSYLTDSYSELIDSAIALEESKEESWQDQARADGWEEPTE